MAETEQLVKFGYLTEKDMLTAISEGILNAYNVCFTRDTHLTYLIDDKLTPVQLKSRVPIYSSDLAALESIKNDPSSYVGEIISVWNDDRFEAYVVNRYPNGTWYIKPIYSPSDISYNDLSDIPFKNIDGKVTEPIQLSDLPEGNYKVTGHFVTPDGVSINSMVGNIVIVEQPNLDYKYITRISSDKIIKYKIGETVIKENYITDKYLDEKHFATEEYVSSQLAAFELIIEEMVKDYVKNTVELLVRHVVNEELNSRYAQQDDIEDLFD